MSFLCGEVTTHFIYPFWHDQFLVLSLYSLKEDSEMSAINIKVTSSGKENFKCERCKG